MAALLSACSCHSQISLKVGHSWTSMRLHPNLQKDQRSFCSIRGMSTELFGQQVARLGNIISSEWSFVGGSRVHSQKNPIFVPYRKRTGISASWLTTSQIASSVFTMGTAAVLPFYTLMVLAPKADLTKRCMESSIPYVVLGLLYAYLLYLSWTPDTIRLMFASQYWLPELSGMAKMFSSEITLASAWIHLLVIDLFAARQVFHDGLENEIETRHSVSLCLLFCPIGIVTHEVTKLLSKKANKTKQSF